MAKGIGSSPENRKKLIGAVIFAVYSIITLIGALNHEIWYDEAQAWCIARDTTLSGLPEVLRHEGHPGLWHLILMPFAKAGAYCEIMSIISWFFSVLAAGIFMLKAPFGLVFKSAVLFSSGFLFYNSVNSRVYCLIPLLLFLIAAIYPKRAKYAPVYGLLVGLLANTHVIMSGLVAALGIFMLIELFQGIKQEGLRKNTGRIIGLFIAGLLVLAMVIPLLGSVSTNSSIQERGFSFYGAVISAATIFNTIGSNLMVLQWNNTVSALFACVLSFIMVFIFVVLFSYRKSFIAAVSFLVMFTVSSGIIWVVLPVRAIAFVYTLVALFWIAKENEKPKTAKILSKCTEKNSGKLTLSVIKAVKNPEKTISVLLCSLLFFSSASGFFWLFFDYDHEYSLSKSAAEFMVNNLPEDAVVVTCRKNVSQFDAYMADSGIEFYSAEIQQFITYNPYIYKNGIDKEKITEDLKDRENLYFIVLTFEEHMLSDIMNFTYPEPVYNSEIFTDLCVQARGVKIYQATLEEILELA